MSKSRRFKVAFIGMTLEATDTLVAAAGIEGYDFLDEAETANALVPVLKAQGVEDKGAGFDIAASVFVSLDDDIRKYFPEMPDYGEPVTVRNVPHLKDVTTTLSLLQMMELAGAHLADLAVERLGGDLRDRSVLVAVGPGNNGGGGLVAARHLVNRGARVRVVLARPARRLSEAGRHQLATLLETSRVVASTLDAVEVMDNILDQVQDLFGVARCAVVVL